MSLITAHRSRRVDSGPVFVPISMIYDTGNYIENDALDRWLIERSTDSVQAWFSLEDIESGDYAVWLNGANGYVVNWIDEGDNGFTVDKAAATVHPRLLEDGYVYFPSGAKLEATISGIMLPPSGDYMVAMVLKNGRNNNNQRQNFGFRFGGVNLGVSVYYNSASGSSTNGRITSSITAGAGVERFYIDAYPGPYNDAINNIVIASYKNNALHEIIVNGTTYGTGDFIATDSNTAYNNTLVDTILLGNRQNATTRMFDYKHFSFHLDPAFTAEELRDDLTQSYQYNTVIGGQGSVTTTAAELETLLGLAAGKVTAFHLSGNDIYAYINTSYAIGANNFINNTVMTSYIDLDGKVTTLNYRSFRNIDTLTYVSFPAVTQSGSDCFAACGALQYADLPSCTRINTTSFSTTPSLIEVNAPLVTRIDSRCFYDSGVNRAMYPLCTLAYDRCFWSCNNLVEVDFTNLMTTSYQLFNGCNNLTEVSFDNMINPGNGTSMFLNCTSLHTVNIPNLTRVWTSMFTGCSSVTQFNFPNVTRIDAKAFKNCTGVVATNGFIFGNVSGTIGNNAFQNCRNYTGEFNFPNATALGSFVFEDCRATTAFDLESVTTVNTYCFIRCYGITELSLPSLTTMTGYGQFNNCSNITLLDLPRANFIDETCCIGASSLTRFNAYRCTNFGGTPGEDGMWYLVNSGFELHVNAHLETNNGGNPDGDVQAAIDDKAATVFYYRNTEIHGEGITTTTAAALETLLGLSAGDVNNFLLVGNDIHCNIHVDYTLPVDVFNGNTDITAYKDKQNRVVGLSDGAFNGATACLEINVPVCVTLGSTVDAQDNVFLNISGSCVITVAQSLQTVDAGNPDFDLVYANGTQGATIIYV